MPAHHSRSLCWGTSKTLCLDVAQECSQTLSHELPGPQGSRTHPQPHLPPARDPGEGSPDPLLGTTVRGHPSGWRACSTTSSPCRWEPLRCWEALCPCRMRLFMHCAPNPCSLSCCLRSTWVDRGYIDQALGWSWSRESLRVLSLLRFLLCQPDTEWCLNTWTSVHAQGADSVKGCRVLPSGGLTCRRGPCALSASWHLCSSRRLLWARPWLCLLLSFRARCSVSSCSWGGRHRVSAQTCCRM